VNSDSRRIDLRQRSQVVSAGLHIQILRRSSSSSAGSMVEIVTVSNPAPVVHRQHHESTIGQRLIFGVLIRVVIGIVPAEKHLPWRSAVDENDGGFFPGRAGFFEELTVDGHSVARFEDDFPRNDKAGRGKISRDAIETDPPGRSAVDWHHRRYWRTLRGRADERDRLTVAGDEWGPLEAGAGCQHLGCRAIDRNPHDVAAVYIIAVATR